MALTGSDRSDLGLWLFGVRPESSSDWPLLCESAVQEFFPLHPPQSVTGLRTPGARRLCGLGTRMFN